MTLLNAAKRYLGEITLENLDGGVNTPNTFTRRRAPTAAWREVPMLATGKNASRQAGWRTLSMDRVSR